jgi:hypothetical protein
MNTIKCTRFANPLRHNFAFVAAFPGQVEVVRVISGENRGRTAIIAWGWKAADRGLEAKAICTLPLVAGEQDILGFSAS